MMNRRAQIFVKGSQLRQDTELGRTVNGTHVIQRANHLVNSILILTLLNMVGQMVIHIMLSLISALLVRHFSGHQMVNLHGLLHIASIERRGNQRRRMSSRNSRRMRGRVPSAFIIVRLRLLRLRLLKLVVLAEVPGPTNSGPAPNAGK